MAFVSTDWSIAANGNIRYIGDDHNGSAPSYATVIEFHRALQDFADDQAASGDDLLDISSLTPSDRSTDNIITLLNGYNIDATAAEHLYDGSIIQNGGDDVYDGIVNFGNPEIELGIIQDGAVLTDDFWNLGGYHGSATGGSTSTLVDSGASWTVNEWIGYTVRNTTDGSQGIITANTATELTIADLMYGGTNNTNGAAETYYIVKGLNSDGNSGISHRFMLQVKSGGTVIDNQKLIGFSRTFGKTYSEFSINQTANGNNVLACSDSFDLNNATAPNAIYDSVGASFVAPFDSITNSTIGYAQIDINNDSTPEAYYSEWDRGTATINQLYEYAKYITRYKSNTFSLYGLDGDLFRGVTHELAVGSPSGTFAANESVTWANGSGQILAIDSTTAPTKVWIQVLTGLAPTSGTITGASTATAVVSSATARPLSYPFIGASTGSALIGAYGVGVEYLDTSSADLFKALDNATYQPPNNVTFTVQGLKAGEDRVLVTSDNGGAINQSQLSNSGLVNGASVSSITVQEAIPSDTPASGTIRVVNANGFHVPLGYSSFSGSTFTLDGTYDFSNGTPETGNLADGGDVYIAYIDELASGVPDGNGFVTASFTVVYNTDRALFIRVRDGQASPIKTFETTGTLGSAGGSTTAIRTADE